jgi:protein phosphatase
MERETVQNLLHAAIKEANRQVYEAARSGDGHDGMGCTAEIVYVQGRRVFIGHVGDCRTYHLQDGRLELLTRDQTLVQRLVELGQITAEEAEKHPQKSELQQAIGGHAEVESEFYHVLLQPGDWLVICSDGLSNHITSAELRHMLVAEATSAEMAARRLVNLANLKGATDNATVVVIRVT